MEQWIALLRDFGWPGVGALCAWAFVRLTPSLGKWLETAALTTKAETVSKLNGTLVEAMRQAVGREVIWSAINEYLGALPEPGRSQLRSHIRQFWASLDEQVDMTIRLEAVESVIVAEEEEERRVRVEDIRRFRRRRELREQRSL